MTAIILPRLLHRGLRRGHVRTLHVTFADGSEEDVSVKCGIARSARRLPKRIGAALCTGGATATLDYDGLARTAVLRGRAWYMRRV